MDQAAEIIDDAAWDAAWRAVLERRLPDGCKLDLRGHLFGSTKITIRSVLSHLRWWKVRKKLYASMEITIAADPPQYAWRAFRGSEICPVCGSATSSEGPRVGVSLTCTHEQVPKLRLGLGAWAHPQCLERCEVIGPAKSVPW